LDSCPLNPKHQAPNTKQIQKLKKLNSKLFWNLNLEFYVCLVFGAWNLVLAV
jgi:hypothetical protein